MHVQNIATYTAHTHIIIYHIDYICINGIDKGNYISLYSCEMYHMNLDVTSPISLVISVMFPLEILWWVWPWLHGVGRRSDLERCFRENNRAASDSWELPW